MRPSSGSSAPTINAIPDLRKSKTEPQSPGFWNIDFVAMKNFKLTERFTMQFRGEFYNIFNHHNMYIQANNLDISGTGVTAINAVNGSPSAGSLNSNLPDERRNIQFALKLLF